MLRLLRRKTTLLRTLAGHHTRGSHLRVRLLALPLLSCMGLCCTVSAGRKQWDEGQQPVASRCDAVAAGKC